MHVLATSPTTPPLTLGCTKACTTAGFRRRQPLGMRLRHIVRDDLPAATLSVGQRACAASSWGMSGTISPARIGALTTFSNGGIGHDQPEL